MRTAHSTARGMLSGRANKGQEAGVRMSPPSPCGARPKTSPVPRSLERNLEEELRKHGEHDHSLIELTTNHHGMLAKLDVVGESLDHDLLLRDSESGQVYGGVGMRLQQERSWGVYVASITPNGPADDCGVIQVDDILQKVDGHVIGRDDRLEDIRERVLGRPSSLVRLHFARPSSGREVDGAKGAAETYCVRLRRATPGAAPAGFSQFQSDHLAVIDLTKKLDLASKEIALLRTDSEHQRKLSVELEMLRVEVRQIQSPDRAATANVLPDAGCEATKSSGERSDSELDGGRIEKRDMHMNRSVPSPSLPKEASDKDVASETLRNLQAQLKEVWLVIHARRPIFS